MRFVLPAILLSLAACGQQQPTTTGDADTALEQSATMGTTTQESASASDMTAGDASASTAPIESNEQYGTFSAAGGGGDATAGTAVGSGSSGALDGASTTGMSGTSGAEGSSQGANTSSAGQ